MASETPIMPQETVLEAVETSLIEDKALSEGCDEHDTNIIVVEKESEKINNIGENGDVVNGLCCQCSSSATKPDKIRPVEVLKILGEGSQGVVALCRFRQKSKPEEAMENKNEETEAAPSSKLLNTGDRKYTKDINY